jgi:hypothetical protein
VFKQLVLARMPEPTSKLDSIRVLEELNVDSVPSYATVKNRLQRVIAEGWRAQTDSKHHRCPR